MTVGYLSGPLRTCGGPFIACVLRDQHCGQALGPCFFQNSCVVRTEAWENANVFYFKKKKHDGRRLQ